MTRIRSLVAACWLLGLTLSVLWLAHAPLATPARPRRALIVGGGPNPENNQVAIESNVRYVAGLLPAQARRLTLFADGQARHATVLCGADAPAATPARRVFDLLTDSDEPGGPDGGHYRRPNLGTPLDGAATRAEITHAITSLSQDAAPDPVLLYFTGHGSPNERDRDNNAFNLWESPNPHEALSVRELAQQIARLPATVPVTLVMVQCFSGAFGNVLFEGGDPQGAVVQRDLAGFFATVRERMAAGCTSAVNEAEYRDFTSYFFAALTGRDRRGRRVTGADYNGDGQVGMNEAFCYTVAHDDSIDVPICTSDVFLRRFVTTPDPEVFATPYTLVEAWATPAQRAALQALSQRLHLTSAGRVQEAYRDMAANAAPATGGGQRRADQQLSQRYETMQKRGHASLWRSYPALAHPGTRGYRSAMSRAVAAVARQWQAGQWRDLIAAEDALGKAEQLSDAAEVTASYRIRFVRLCKSVVLAHQLEAAGDTATQARFRRLLMAEGRTLLPAVAVPG